MAPERVSKRFRRLYGRCGRELARYADADAVASERLNKILIIQERWPLLERADLYEAAQAVAGLQGKLLGKQAAVLQASTEELERALLELEDAVESLRQVSREGRSFVTAEYRSSSGRSRRPGGDEDGEDEDRTLTIAASDYVDGLYAIFKMHSRSARLKRAVYEEIKACKTDAERRELARYFVSPPCMDQALVSGLLSRARA